MGVEKHGRSWTEILRRYRDNFKRGRNSSDLISKYFNLERNKENLSNLKKKAKLLHNKLTNNNNTNNNTN